MGSAELGKWLLLAGLGLALLGGLLLLASKLGWPGRLPGDLTIRRGDVTIHLPLATSLLLSLLLTVALNIIARLLRK